MIEETITTPEIFALIVMCVILGYVLAKIANKK
jgi:hypothetical protein